MITLEQCKKFDQEDELTNLKELFDLPAGTIYLDGNSLGAMPKDALAKATDIISRQWGVDLINSWNKNSWWQLPVSIGNQLAPLIGAKENEAIITDTTSTNLFKVLANAINIQKEAHPNKKVILAERDAFPTDLYIIQGINKFLNQGYRLELIDSPEDLSSALTDEVAVAVISHVNYRTGYLYDMAVESKRIHDNGSLVIWDLCHSIGAVPINLEQDGADFAIGCTYKYLNGGPGAPAMLWANPKFKQSFGQPLSGWWGHAKPFDMALDYEPDSGIRSFLCGTQPIVSMGLISAGLDIFAKTNMAKIRAKSLHLTDLFINLVAQECAGLDLILITPLDHKYRGSHVSFRHPSGYALIQALIARGVIGDYREPEVARFGVTPLYLSAQDIWDAVQHIKAVLVTKEWDQEKFRTRGLVT